MYFAEYVSVFARLRQRQRVVASAGLGSMITPGGAAAGLGGSRQSRPISGAHLGSDLGSDLGGSRRPPADDEARRLWDGVRIEAEGEEEEVESVLVEGLDHLHDDEELGDVVQRLHAQERRPASS